MSCTEWRDGLMSRLYEEPGAEDDAALTAHLEACASCRGTLAEFQRVRGLLREDAAETPRVPRVVVLQPRAKFRPALLAASLLGAAALAGAGAGAGYALGSGRAPAPPTVAQAKPTPPDVSTEELVKREVERRLAALQDSRALPAGTASGERPLSASDLRAELAKFERRLDGARATDLDYMLGEIAASEFRIGARLGKTNDALRTVALATNPYANEQ